MNSLHRLIFVFLVLRTAWAILDTDVCTPETDSCGPIPPPLPINFELKGAYVDNLKKSLGYEEIYFDFDNLRGKYMMLSEGIEKHLIFDYNASQVIEYLILHPGSTVKQDPLSFGCGAQDLGSSNDRSIFGYRFSPNGITNTLMYDSAHVLRFGGPYQYSYNGSSFDEDSDDDRGVPWNAFIGCVYEDNGEVSALVRYKFTNDSLLISPGGNVRSQVDGSGDMRPLSVPLAVHYTGNKYVTDSGGNRLKTQFDVRQHFQWFKANPIFDNKNLQIPPWIHCDKYIGWKAMPKFPMVFSTRVETTAYSQDLMGTKTAELLSVEDVYYYNEKGLARRDFTPHKEKDGAILSAFGNGSPVKEIYDYVSLQIYTINKATGQCFSRTLDTHAHFSKPTDTVFTEMATPEELFLMQQEDMEYKGQYFTRDIECDVWNGKYYDNQLNMTFYKETYFTTNGWHSEVDENIEYRIPIKHSVVSNRVDGEFFRTVVENNFFKFKAYPPVLAYFDIAPCVETIEHKYFAIKLAVPEGDPQNTLATYKFLFLESAQYYLATVSDLVSPLRIQQISLSISKSGVFLTFAMLEKPGVKDGILNPSKGVTVEDAVIKLREVVNEGNFEIIFVHPLNREKIPIVAEPGSLYDWYPTGKVTAAKKPGDSSWYAENRAHQPQIIYERLGEDVRGVFHDDAATAASKKQKTGMSGGALVGLAIGMLLMGVAIGIAVMYLYFRKYGESSGGNDYVMHTTN